jgi:hypothetical protein
MSTKTTVRARSGKWRSASPELRDRKPIELTMYSDTIETLTEMAKREHISRSLVVEALIRGSGSAGPSGPRAHTACNLILPAKLMDKLIRMAEQRRETPSRVVEALIRAAPL